jgi:hypothetical protein
MKPPREGFADSLHPQANCAQNCLPGCLAVLDNPNSEYFRTLQEDRMVGNSEAIVIPRRQVCMIHPIHSVLFYCPPTQFAATTS